MISKRRRHFKFQARAVLELEPAPRDQARDRDVGIARLNTM